MDTIKPKWIIFDAGGVLYHFSKAITETANLLGVTNEELLRAYFKNFREVEISKKHYRERVKEILLYLQKDHTIESVISVLFDVEKHLQDTLLLVQQLNTAGYSLALLTNTWHGVTGEITSQIKEFHLFQQIFDSSALGIRKPEKEMFLHVEKTLQATGEQLFFVDDRLENIQAAQELHWQTFLYDLGKDEGKSSNNTLRQILL